MITPEEQEKLIENVYSLPEVKQLLSMTKEQLLSITLIACARVGFSVSEDDELDSVLESVTFLKRGIAVALDAYNVAKKQEDKNKIDAVALTFTVGHA